MEIPVRKVRLDDEVWQYIQALPGKTPNDKLRGLFEKGSGDPIAAETLELVRSLPDLENIKAVVEDALQAKIDERAAVRTSQTSNPASIPSVQRGGYPRRESGYERALREKLEAEQRVQDLDSVEDPSIDRSAEFVSS